MIGKCKELNGILRKEFPDPTSLDFLSLYFASLNHLLFPSDTLNEVSGIVNSIRCKRVLLVSQHPRIKWIH